MSSVTTECCYPSCRNPVIGQCPGYSSRCGQFYCRVHSEDNLCYRCATSEQAISEETLQQQAMAYVLKKYTALAEQTPMMSDLTILFWAALMGLMCLSIVELLFRSTMVGAVIGIVVFLITLPRIRTRSEARETEWLNKVSQSHPGFSDFYTLWKRYRGQEERQALNQAFVGAVGIAAISAVALSAAAFSANAKSEQFHRNKQVSDDVRAIRRRIEKM